MPRPRMCRWIRHRPPVQAYFPQQPPPGGPLRGVTLPLDGLEALRLVDAEGFDQEGAARFMGVSRPTLSRMLAEARELVARALVNGWAIRIEGGHARFTDEPPPESGGGRRRRRRGGE